MALIAPPVEHSTIRQFAEARVNLPADVAKECRQKVNDLRERLARLKGMATVLVR